VGERPRLLAPFPGDCPWREGAPTRGTHGGQFVALRAVLGKGSSHG